MWEGRHRKGSKDYITEWGKNPAKATRCLKPLHNIGRTIMDAGFVSAKCAQGLAEKGLYIIGNVNKGADSCFPKQWLLSNVHVRGCRVVATSSFTISSGEEFQILASADKDKQRMALLGTVGTSGEAPPRYMKFTAIRSDGTYQVRSAHLHHDDIHRQYRDAFNVININNSKRQGGFSFEDTWKTHLCYVRDFHMLFGISEVNAFLLYRHLESGQKNARVHDFRNRLTYQRRAMRE
jgi:hypothetical protein